MSKKVIIPVFGIVLVICGTVFAVDGTLWVRRYDGPGHGDDQVCAVLTDAERNVIVVGTALSTTTAYDIIVFKYSPDGDSVWAKRIAGSGASNEIAVAAAIDATGAVYLTGTTGTYPDYNILTIKLNPDGSEVWRDIYQGPAGKDDSPTALAIDGAGNVYVTGYEKNADNVEDYITIKYNATGGREWHQSYDGGGVDVSRAIAVGT
ncbi:MAG: SBBP repeat-containing protein, partial [candidate division WOR-3 bacterium]|nr:SBBP repeat-containing protein [candidate division WOR-3 bacterium]